MMVSTGKGNYPNFSAILRLVNYYNPLPIGSMYAIYGNIYHQYTPNVSIYTIHGSYGLYIVYIYIYTYKLIWVCPKSENLVLHVFLGNMISHSIWMRGNPIDKSIRHIHFDICLTVVISRCWSACQDPRLFSDLLRSIHSRSTGHSTLWSIEWRRPSVGMTIKARIF